MHPRFIKVEHNGICALVCVRNICHEVRVYGITTMATAWIIEINHIEFRFYLVPVQVVHHMVVGNHREVGKLEVIDIHGVPLLDLLLDEVVYNSIGLTATRCTEDDGCTERIHDIYPAFVPLLFIVEPCGQIDRVVICQKPCFLHKTLVLVVEDIFHQVVLQESAHPKSSHQQTDIACRHCRYV